jgi:hypothetical protein
MTTELPIACSLTPAELPARVAEIGAIGRANLLSAEVEAGRAVLRFRSGGAVRERLASVVAAEAECCAFLAMTLRDEADLLVLTIEAPSGAEPVVRELVTAFEG